MKKFKILFLLILFGLFCKCESELGETVHSYYTEREISKSDGHIDNVEYKTVPLAEQNLIKSNKHETTHFPTTTDKSTKSNKNNPKIIVTSTTLPTTSISDNKILNNARATESSTITKTSNSTTEKPRKLTTNV